MMYKIIQTVFSIFFFLSINGIIIHTQAAADLDVVDTRCKKQVITRTYDYEEFFKFSNENYKNGTLHLTFRVLAASNAHIVFTNKPFTSLDQDNVKGYEIVLGAGGNTYCEIRRFNNSLDNYTEITSLDIDGLLSLSEVREFTISISQNRAIYIRKNNDTIPFIFKKDPDPIMDLGYFGFSTWYSVDGVWNFDCHGDGSTTYDPSFSLTESLRNKLLMSYDRFSIPFNISDDWTPINISFNPYHAKLDPKHGQITLVGKFMLAWVDEKLKWDPASYGNITSLQLMHGEIWSPELVLYNAVGHGVNRMIGPSGIVVSNMGKVYWNPNSRLHAQCPLKHDSSLKENHKCEIQLGLWATQNIFRFVWINDTSQGNMPIQPSQQPWLMEDNLNVTSKCSGTRCHDDKGNNDFIINGRINSNTLLVLAITVKANDDSLYLSIVKFPVIVLTILFLSSCWMSSWNEFRSCLMLSAALLMTAFYRMITVLHSRDYHILDITYGVFASWITLGTGALIFANYLKSCSGSRKPNTLVLNFVEFKLVQKMLTLPEDTSESYELNKLTGEEYFGEHGEDTYARQWESISILIRRLTFYASLVCVIWYWQYKF
ncbi:uncharacterized protein LOC111053763 [Nilaparvata lugens]|uniref:uncharacterized protein LOC111053763 n=1 Tax=Nilaparvata lugens TaxID=108931 RepID=UPI00193E0BDB|nr:uncharacterized protein LOC111053763 [Nilaparvata lugens]